MKPSDWVVCAVAVALLGVISLTSRTAVAWKLRASAIPQNTRADELEKRCIGTSQPLQALVYAAAAKEAGAKSTACFQRVQKQIKQLYPASPGITL